MRMVIDDCDSSDSCDVGDNWDVSDNWDVVIAAMLVML
jgi:hypothetical protein